jgi:hypothetical protein
VQQHTALFKHEFYMGELYHGYRSLTLYCTPRRSSHVRRAAYA